MSKFIFNRSSIIYGSHMNFTFYPLRYGTWGKKSIRFIDACFRVFNVFAYTLNVIVITIKKLSFVHFPSHKYGLTCEIKGFLVTYIRNRFHLHNFYCQRHRKKAPTISRIEGDFPYFD